MSVIRQIRTLYTISINTFIFILWTFLLGLLIGAGVSDRLYIISLLSTFLLQFLLNKLLNKKAALVISVAAAEVLTFLLIGRSGFIYNSIFNIFIIMAVRTSEDEEVNYESLKLRAKQWLSVILGLGLFAAISNLNGSSSLLRFYIIFLVTMLIVLREARNYFYGIRNKKSLVVNIVMAASILLISLESIFDIVLQVIKLMINYMQMFLNIIINLIAILMRVPLQIAINYLGKRQAKNPNLFEMVAGNNKERSYENLISESKDLPHWLNITLECIIFIILIFIAYRIFLSYNRGKRKKETPVIEEREKISYKTKKEGFIKQTIKRIFKPSSLREQVFNIYKKFQNQAYEKGIYKEHMTAKQLENVTKTYIENVEGLKELTNVYNEIKFSKHEVKKENVELIKESYDKVKKQL